MSYFRDPSCCISKFTGWAVLEELSIRRRVRTFLVSWGQTTRVKYCYVDLSSSHEFRFAIIFIDMNVILDLSTRSNNFRDGFDCQCVNTDLTENLFYTKIQRKGMILQLDAYG